MKIEVIETKDGSKTLCGAGARSAAPNVSVLAQTLRNGQHAAPQHARWALSTHGAAGASAPQPLHF